MSDDTYEIYAIRYGKSVRKRSESFIGGDPHEGPMDMAYYVWLVRNAARTIVMDTGFAPDVAKSRAREFLKCPGETIRALGTDPDKIDTVVLSHLHYDHAGNHNLFPNATFHVQAAEMAYVTGPWMRFRHLRAGYGAQDVKAVVDRIFAERLVWHEGDSALAPGLDLLHMGGHCAGLQAMVVNTRRGPVVLASDSAVFYEGLETGRPFPPAFHVGDELAGYERLLALTGSADGIIPGHDVRVMERYPQTIEGLAWRVDETPIAP
ncbi:N-acyl homoserine lactonase family protein [Roseobacter sp.]|uniref:N-acyl homoserine lactonase family protein n=1 Tax=Roseobacter sp. TaxID=1907202 RepID=UPI003859A1CC